MVTPHDREFARLAGETVGTGPGGRGPAAGRSGCGVVVLLKGDRTVVATPDGTAWANPTGTPALATAGTGDVLAGLLVLAARGGPAGRSGPRSRRPTCTAWPAAARRSAGASSAATGECGPR